MKLQYLWNESVMICYTKFQALKLLGFAPVQEVDNLSGGQCSAVARKDAEVWNNFPHINTLI